MPTPVAVARSSRYSPIPFAPDPELAARVLERLAGGSGRRGVAIKDLDTGRGVLIDPDGEYEMASLFKLTVMYEVFKQRELGVLSFDETLVLTARHVAYDLGTLDRGEGSTIGLGEAVERMITISDNSSAILLTDRVGAGNINQDLRALGMEHTRLILDDLTTSPADMLLFLEMLARGQGVNASASADMVHLMARQRVRDRIPRLLPAEATTANKTGNLPGVVNDVGIVYAPDATFAIAVLIDGTRDEGEAARTTADIAATAYEYLRAVHGNAPTTHLPTAAPAPTPRPTVPRSPLPTPAPQASVTVAPTETPAPTEPPATATLEPPTAVPVTAVQAATAVPRTSIVNTAVPSTSAPTSPPTMPTAQPEPGTPAQATIATGAPTLAATRSTSPVATPPR
jgi:beta-lactamase class A